MYAKQMIILRSFPFFEDSFHAIPSHVSQDRPNRPGIPVLLVCYFCLTSEDTNSARTCQTGKENWVTHCFPYGSGKRR